MSTYFIITGQLAVSLGRSQRVVRSYSSALSALRSEIQQELDAIKQQGTHKTERVITSKQDNKITVEGSNQEVLNFCANNYLGLSVSVDVSFNNSLFVPSTIT